MKNVFAVLIAVCLMVGTAFAVEQGNTLRTDTFTLYSSATGTTSAVNTSTHTFDYPMKYLACDLMTGISATTANTTFTIDGNMGSSTTLFAGTPILVTSTTLAGSTTGSALTTVRSASGVPYPFKLIRATITAPTTTQVITINCSAIQ